MQVIRRVLISLCMFFFGFISSVYANHQGYDCSVCHDSVDTRNLSLILEVISTPNSGPKEVWFTSYTGWRSFADGDIVYDGVCEVCHTYTSYHTNYGDGTEHFDGEDCRLCHLHENDFLPLFVVSYSHDTHLNDPKGPQFSECTDCHLPVNYSLFADGNPLSTTMVCNPCHSPDGAFDGVDDPTIGAKPNWDNGIYEEGGSQLKPGKENWCATCHDDGSSVINGVSATNVMGDNISYGYLLSGHGKSGFLRCYDCHDLTVLHTDGNARTYLASSDNYREGYRLNDDMAVPRNGETGPTAFKLCFNCHMYSYVMGPPSNFRDDNTGVQLHDKHLGSSFAYQIAFDSDFDGIDCSSGTCADSAISCTACHNIHGSPTPAMIRHGELISTYGTTDKVPALRFRWYKADGFTQTTVFEESRYGGLLCGEEPDVSFNHVCWGCHPTGEVKYYRAPTQVECILIPDTTTIPQGGTLGFHATVINHTDKSGIVLFATDVTKPDENRYPPSGYLIGPLEVYLNPYQSKSGHRSHAIPLGAPTGIYTYHGYVGRYDIGKICECQFEFFVTSP